ncbi:hypothetical protein GXW74_00240 [Roseomonas eburnea]|uniref:Uncharacterized protein n=1 Tax=Neoroseomonas eburnea TaxID=1346889 RepID=A0A9X9X5B7_9PROT|nr:hypothetical protein [Neoroseomonas eburnea]MBR0678903.1 hypothetical protein [Neoroseomonas eburnea]
MPQVRLPLSGDVTQVINPWTWILQGNRLNLLTVNVGYSVDPDLEQEILEGVGSYGRQIGHITEALEVIIRRSGLIENPDLPREEKDALLLLLQQAAAVREVKRGVRAGAARRAAA